MQAADVAFIKGLWEVNHTKGTMLVRARNRRDAAEIALNAIYYGHPECKLIRETRDHCANTYHATFEVENWGMAKTTVHLVIRRPEVFV